MCWGVVVVVGVGVWWCVECCIVDASILLCLVLWFEKFMPTMLADMMCVVLVGVVVKCCRAQGGCLGIRSR